MYCLFSRTSKLLVGKTVKSCDLSSSWSASPSYFHSSSCKAAQRSNSPSPSGERPGSLPSFIQSNLFLFPLSSARLFSSFSSSSSSSLSPTTTTNTYNSNNSEPSSQYRKDIENNVTEEESKAMNEWVNRVETKKGNKEALLRTETDRIDVHRVRGLVSTLETEGEPPQEWVKGKELPVGWTMLLFLPNLALTSTLGFDGAERGSYHPDAKSGPFERMWVGGSFDFLSSVAKDKSHNHQLPMDKMKISTDDPTRLKIDDQVICQTTVDKIQAKTGKDGRKGWYVHQKREISKLDSGDKPMEGVSVVERRIHLYRRPSPKLSPSPLSSVSKSSSSAAAPETRENHSKTATETATLKDAPIGLDDHSTPKVKDIQTKERDFEMSFKPTPEILMRFSALTFNTHRIHWDNDYAVREEGRGGLLVHGPLTALLLLNTLRQNSNGRSVARFEYRATRPLVVNTVVRFCGKRKKDDASSSNCDLWVEDDEGNIYMTGEGSWF